MEHYETKAKSMGIPLSRAGHKKTKDQLQRAINYRKSSGRK